MGRRMSRSPPPMPPLSVSALNTTWRRQLNPLHPTKEGEAPGPSASCSLGLFQDPPLRPSAPEASGDGVRAAATRSRPVHARALTVAGGPDAHVPRTTGGAARAAGDGEACGRERRGLGAEPEGSRGAGSQAPEDGSRMRAWLGARAASVLRELGPRYSREAEAGTPWILEK